MDKLVEYHCPFVEYEMSKRKAFFLSTLSTDHQEHYRFLNLKEKYILPQKEIRL